MNIKMQYNMLTHAYIFMTSWFTQTMLC